jgi:peroxiredoxin
MKTTMRQEELDEDNTRWVRLGEQRVALLGRLPQPGDVLTAEFSIPEARRASLPLLAADLRQGLVIVSTLPNIQKHACLAQIVELEERSVHLLPSARVVHISADHADHWGEVDAFHPDVQAPGYSLCCADSTSRETFIVAFGIGVAGHHRIAHGLFALHDGRFLSIEVPENQMHAPEVERFLKEFSVLLEKRVV